MNVRKRVRATRRMMDRAIHSVGRKSNHLAMRVRTARRRTPSYD